MLTRVNKLTCRLSEFKKKISLYITSAGYLTARENEVELLTIKFCSLRIISVKKFHEKSVCNKIEWVQVRFVQIQHFKTIQPRLAASNEHFRVLEFVRR